MPHSIHLHTTCQSQASHSARARAETAQPTTKDQKTELLVLVVRRMCFHMFDLAMQLTGFAIGSHASFFGDHGGGLVGRYALSGTAVAWRAYMQLTWVKKPVGFRNEKDLSLWLRLAGAMPRQLRCLRHD